MKQLTALIFALVVGSPAALAHTGHVAESGGHSHWFGLAALALAAGVAAWQAIRIAGRRAQRSRDG